MRVYMERPDRDCWNVPNGIRYLQFSLCGGKELGAYATALPGTKIIRNLARTKKGPSQQAYIANEQPTNDELPSFAICRIHFANNLSYLFHAASSKYLWSQYSIPGTAMCLRQNRAAKVQLCPVYWDDYRRRFLLIRLWAMAAIRAITGIRPPERPALMTAADSAPVMPSHNRQALRLTRTRRYSAPR